MKVLKPDYSRRIAIEGVPEPVKRPVDVDQAQTGFKDLRTLRIYRFLPGSVIDGHAEEDEVFILLLSGSAELTLISREDATAPVLLGGDGDASTSAAYLPPEGAYKLVAQTLCDVAYIRATPVGLRPAKFFSRHPKESPATISVLLEESGHAEKLQMRLVRSEATIEDTELSPIHFEDVGLEMLVHLRTVTPAVPVRAIQEGAEAQILEMGDTVAVCPGECLTLRIPAGSSAELLTVSAKNERLATVSE